MAWTGAKEVSIIPVHWKSGAKEGIWLRYRGQLGPPAAARIRDRRVNGTITTASILVPRQAIWRQLVRYGEHMESRRQTMQLGHCV